MSKREVVRNALLPLVESYFNEYLCRVRGASRHTVLAYRDALRLFFCFLAETCCRSVARLGLDDLHAEDVLAFLDHLERKRGNSVATRNARLAAIRSFAEHLVRHDPTRAGQYQRILSLPTKKSHQPSVPYLEPEEVSVLLRQPDCSTRLGLRDHALLLFLYNTGARVSEALAVRQTDVQFQRPYQVRIHGKGNRERFCPLWPDTAKALRQIVQVAAEADQAFFLNARGQRLTRDGVAYLIRKYTKMAARETKTLSRRSVTPHILRHSCAVALLQAGVDVTVIRDYLGHASVMTTSRYLSTNLEMKRQVLDAFWERAGLSVPSDSTWIPETEVLAFLSSL